MRSPEARLCSYSVSRARYPSRVYIHSPSYGGGCPAVVGAASQTAYPPLVAEAAIHSTRRHIASAAQQTGGAILGLPAIPFETFTRHSQLLNYDADTLRPTRRLIGALHTSSGELVHTFHTAVRTTMKWTLAIAAILVSGGVGAQAQVLFSEDFEGVTLGISPEERLQSTPPSPPVPVISLDPPAGWTEDNSGVPGIGDQDNGGIDDWEGWSFVDESFWVAADDQRRSEFRDGFGEGVVAVADADEWDDVNSPADNIGFFNAFMTSPAIDISDAPGLVVEFASSWRDEAFDDDGIAGDPSDDNTNNQTAVLNLTVDGVTTEILRWESDPASAFFKDDAPNELVTVDLQGVTGSSAQLEFGLVNAGNDWWWAVDNVSVSVGIPEPTSVMLVAMGLVGLAARRR